jgi:hypothetical protein
MPDLTHWMLVSILGPLMLPVFMLITLCMIAGAKPEPIVGSFISLIGAVVVGCVRLLSMLLSAIFHVPAPRKYPPRPTHPRPKPSDAAKERELDD